MNDISVCLGIGIPNLPDRIERSSGIRLVPPAEAHDSGYYPGAPVPNDSWLAAGSELRVFRGLSRWNDEPHLRICVTRILDPCVGYIRDILRSGAADEIYQQSIDLVRQIDMLDSRIQEEFIVLGSEIKKHGVVCKAGGLTTVTVDSRTGLKPGIHLDSWAGTGKAARATSLIRININLGPSPRYFLFCAQSIDQIEALATDGPENYQPRGNTLYYEYLSKNRDVPIYRLKVLPGEAYIAATDCILHDGSTLCSNDPVHTFQIAGNLKRLTDHQ